MTKKATRPREIVYMEYIPFPTEKDGIIFTFFAIDDYTEYAIMIGQTKEISDDVYLDMIELLMNHEKFRLHDHPFELVLAFGGYMAERIGEKIKPHGGTPTFDEQRVDQGFKPFLQSFMDFQKRNS